MQAYKFNTRVSEKGIISLPFGSKLFNTDVEVIILPKFEKKTNQEEKEYTAMDFLRDWTGILADVSDEEVANFKYEHLMEKHK
jgi:hypothetical protein